MAKVECCIEWNEWDMARTADTYTNWARTYEEATQALTDRERRIHEACDMIEQNLFLLGASAIEDKLQDKACHALCRLDCFPQGFPSLLTRPSRRW
jgi:magnesium-transporting ATPase (P-type)